MATLNAHLTCKGCGRRVPGTVAGFCGRCLEEDEALAALQKAVGRMKQMIENRREAARMTNREA